MNYVETLAQNITHNKQWPHQCLVLHKSKLLKHFKCKAILVISMLSESASEITRRCWFNSKVTLKILKLGKNLKCYIWLEFTYCYHYFFQLNAEWHFHSKYVRMGNLLSYISKEAYLKEKNEIGWIIDNSCSFTPGWIWTFPCFQLLFLSNDLESYIPSFSFKSQKWTKQLNRRRKVNRYKTEKPSSPLNELHYYPATSTNSS